MTRSRIVSWVAQFHFGGTSIGAAATLNIRRACQPRTRIALVALRARITRHGCGGRVASQPKQRPAAMVRRPMQPRGVPPSGVRFAAPRRAGSRRRAAIARTRAPCQ
jgi:hypothetical protein